MEVNKKYNIMASNYRKRDEVIDSYDTEEEALKVLEELRYKEQRDKMLNKIEMTLLSPFSYKNHYIAVYYDIS